MYRLFVSFFFVLLAIQAGAQESIKTSVASLPVYHSQKPATDWLIDNSSYPAGVYRNATGTGLVLSNGLVSRTFTLTPNLACYSFRNEITGQEFLRAIKPEALLTFDGKLFEVGGLQGQFEYGYLETEWLPEFENKSLFLFSGFTLTDIKPPFDWQPQRWIPDYNWPPKGKEVIFNLKGSVEVEGIEVEIHYEIYDGIPLISKWITIINHSGKAFTLNRFVSETLAFVEEDVSVDKMQSWQTPNLLLASNYSFMGMTPKSADRVTRWLTDSVYTSQVNYELKTPCRLECSPPIGPDALIPAGGSFNTFRMYELPFDSYDKERKGLATRRLYRTVSPWALENPIFLHLTSTDPDVIKTAVDQCSKTGFEMIILSFGSGLNMESTDSTYIRNMKEITEFCRNHGIELGGYSLLASRRINDEEDVINPATGKTGGAVFGNSPCLGSRWGKSYFDRLQHFIETTGFSLLEHDGSYPGDVCASTLHPGHRGLDDSQWNQWRKITSFYEWCRSRDIYLNVPDWYFLAGSNKTGIGYRETNWSLPRDRQIMLGRQNLYDGTWEKTPSMGWTFVPLVEYQGGGAAATLEPLSQHMKEYDAHLFQNFGAGVQACYRGSRLFDTPEVMQRVKAKVDWYKKYRLILNSDIIHLRRADGRDWDGFMHVNPGLKEKALILLFNPLNEPIEREIILPLYYTGLSGKAMMRLQEGKPFPIVLNCNGETEIKVKIPANGYSWWVVE